MEISNDHTPLNVDKLKKSVISKVTPERNEHIPFRISKYDIILGVSILSFVAGLSFWIFVTYML